MLGTVDIDSLVVGEIERAKGRGAGDGHGPAEGAHDDAARDVAVTGRVPENERAELEHRRGQGGHELVTRDCELVSRPLEEGAVRGDGLFGICLTHEGPPGGFLRFITIFVKKKGGVF